MFKKIISVILASAVIFTGCGSLPEKDSSKINIVCTVFPVYDWTRQIIGDSDNINLTYLLGNGSDLHNFQPTTDDMIKISDCDIFIYIGGESDKWVTDALLNAQNKDMKVVNLLDVLADSVVEEEVKEGMSAENETDEETEYDEHIWLSIANARKCINEITYIVGFFDNDNSQKYLSNANDYLIDLTALDSMFQHLFEDNPQTLIFGDRFPFRYFVEDYNLDYYAAFTGCSADTDASFETITFLAEKADELNADTIFAIENSDCTVADAVIENTKSKSQSIAVLDSAQSVTNQQIESGVTYLSIMQKNYDVLQEVFQ
ncbi:MAG: metal ABC transporter substrate-binding protein [Ruminococcus sp.]|nr:metal ABC transporter substrate-binding protein [Ruminococcus sp.]